MRGAHSALLLSLAVLASASGVVLAGSAHAARSVHASKTVAIKEQHSKYLYAPAKTTVKAGTRVTWSNGTDAPHTVTGTGSWKFASKTFKTHQSVSFVFRKAGTYHYMCTIHPYMTGTVVVTK